MCREVAGFRNDDQEGGTFTVDELKPESQECGPIDYENVTLKFL